MSFASRLAAVVAVASVSSGTSCNRPFTAHQAFAPAPTCNCVAEAVQSSRDQIGVRELHRHGFQWLVAEWPDSGTRDHRQQVGIVRTFRNWIPSETLTVVSSWTGGPPPRDVSVVGDFALSLFHAIGANCDTKPQSDIQCEVGSDEVTCT